MIADAQAGSFDAVLVLKVDRFARSIRDATLYRELLNDHGVRAKSRTEPGVGERTPAGFLMGACPTSGQRSTLSNYRTMWREGWRPAHRRASHWAIFPSAIADHPRGASGGCA